MSHPGTSLPHSTPGQQSHQKAATGCPVGVACVCVGGGCQGVGEGRGTRGEEERGLPLGGVVVLMGWCCEFWGV